MKHNFGVDDHFTTTSDFLVVLDSRNATNYLNGTMNSKLQFFFEDSIRRPKNTISMSCSVTNFTCPNSFYQINSTNNILKMTLSNINYTLTYTIPQGNYNEINFISTLTSLLPSGFTITFNTITNKFTITHSSLDFTLYKSSTIYAVMGFTNAQDYTSTSLTLTLPYPVNFSGLNSINIHFANVMFRSLDSLTSSCCCIVATAPVNASPGGVIYYNQTTRNAFEVKEDVLDFIQINLRDDLGNFIDLNNGHYNLTLIFTITRDIDMNPSTFRDIVDPSLSLAKNYHYPVDESQIPYYFSMG